MTKEEAKTEVENALKFIYTREHTTEVLEALSVEPQTAEWILGGYDDMYYVCSKCNAKVSEYYRKPRFNYCPNCGAKIKGGEA